MLVVSDTSPLNYLVLVDAIETLPVLFDEICIPPAVLAELRDHRSLDSVRKWAESPPSWLEVRIPRSVVDLPGLHYGEMEAIALAEELAAVVMLIDDRIGKQVASQRGLRVMGTLGVLAQAALKNLINLEQTTQKLRQTSFRGRVELLQEIVDEHRQRGNDGT
jgi:predicted nucleic acid-binding protein